MLSCYVTWAGFKFVILLPLLLKVSPFLEGSEAAGWGGELRTPPPHSLLPPGVSVRGSRPSESQDFGKCYRLCSVVFQDKTFINTVLLLTIHSLIMWQKPSRGPTP